LKTDQDNAIIFADVPESDFEQVKIYFLKLGIQVCAWLDEAGYTFCKGNVMAQNPKWCQPLSKWKTFFKSWIRVSTGEDLMEAAIFFDFRGAYGNMAMADELRAYLFEALSGWTRFFRDLAASALGFKPPIGLFRNFVLESKGPHPNTIDIKKAMTPVVDAARIYALHHNIAETNTQERLYHLHLKDVLKADVYDELDQAYNYLLRQRLLCQIDSIEKGESPHNHLNPKTLSRLEQSMLKEIFKRIEGIQNKMNVDFTGGM
jgi:CBS domain-containing protein